jgi:hypothetical protein
MTQFLVHFTVTNMLELAQHSQAISLVKSVIEAQPANKAL